MYLGGSPIDYGQSPGTLESEGVGFMRHLDIGALNAFSSDVGVLGARNLVRMDANNRDNTKLTGEQASALAKSYGPAAKPVEADTMSEAAARIVHEGEVKAADAAHMEESTPWPWQAGGSYFGTAARGLVEIAAQPTNLLALAFLKTPGSATFKGLVDSAIGLAPKAGYRMLEGAAQGITAGAAVEAATVPLKAGMGIHTEPEESLINIGVMGALGAALHAGTGAFGDIMAGRGHALTAHERAQEVTRDSLNVAPVGMTPPEGLSVDEIHPGRPVTHAPTVPPDVAAADPLTNITAARVAMTQAMQGHPVQVDPVYALAKEMKTADPELSVYADRKVGGFSVRDEGNSQRLAGPFASADEAQAWIKDFFPKDETRPVSTEPPRQVVGTDPDGWVNHGAQQARDLADRRGLTPLVESLFAEGKTLAQVATALGDKLDFLPYEERTTFLTQTRATLGIPSQMAAEGKAEFAVWKKTYDARQSAKALADAAAKADVQSVAERAEGALKGNAKEPMYGQSKTVPIEEPPIPEGGELAHLQESVAKVEQELTALQDQLKASGADVKVDPAIAAADRGIEQAGLMAKAYEAVAPCIGRTL